MRFFSNQACEELRNQEIEIMHLQKQIMEWEAKIKQQQNLYETARTERTVNSRKVLESQNEIDEMKRKFKLMNQLVEQLKEEINSKDIALIKEHYDHQKVYTSKAFLLVHHGVFCLLSSHNIVFLPSSETRFRILPNIYPDEHSK
jgi:CTP synthase (UTP-ammonia lyase)